MHLPAISEKRIRFQDKQEIVAVCGRHDEYLTVISQYFDGSIVARGDEISITGETGEVEKIARLFDELLFLYRNGTSISMHDIRYSVTVMKENGQEHLHQMFAETLLITARGRHIRPKTLGQRRYLEAIRKNCITFGIGPAGTGKTYLAVAMAIFSLKNKEVERIILTRPAIEAGEKLGFLPGDLQDKVDPYLRPLYDSLQDILGVETFQKYVAKNIIEVAPLAYMRGRTLDDSFIILDEAQNTTLQQMKMFLTRIGFGSKIVVTGDVTQIDLPRDSISGLKHVKEIFSGIPSIEIMFLNDSDIVRHDIVSQVIKAYERYEQKT